MKNITFSADEHTIELARDEARKRKTTLNQLFREWIEDLSARDELDAHITHLPKLSREQMNER
jgi:hypothetical protein